MAAQDPDEPFDLCDAEGAPLGRVKARAAVHRDGDWHRSLHVWVILVGDGAPSVVFQKRSDAKDTWPGALDVAVAGHYRAGEDLGRALRESEEEIGLRLAPRDVERLGVRRRADDHAPGIRDHEIQDVFLARTSRRLEELRPAADEVDALVAVALDEVVRLFATSTRAAGRLLRGGARETEPAVVERGDFVGADDGYWELAVSSIAERLAHAPGAAQEGWRLGWPDRPSA